MTMVVDLRSDTVTQPSEAMRAAMAAAEVGDDLTGDDPTVAALEERVADMLGMESAVFTPTGTMANQIAIALHTRPGDSVLAEEGSHCFLYESGAAAALSGVQHNAIPMTVNWSADAVAQAVHPEWHSYATTSLLVVENTHTHGDGRALPPVKMAEILALGRQHHLRVHCDGARLWNAAAAYNCQPGELVRGFDTVAVCFSKGLGAPVGSALALPQAVRERALKLRKRFGGSMRQSGIVAAGALHALEHHLGDLQADHQRAERFRRALSSTASVAIRCPDPMTNMLYFRPHDGDGEGLRQRFAEQGILMHHLGGGWLRAVFHRDIADIAINYAATITKQLLGAGDK